MSGFFDVYSIIFLIIAVVIFMRLGSVLGRRTGSEPTAYDPGVNRTQAPSSNDNVVALPHRERPAARSGGRADLEQIERHAKPGTALHDGLVAISNADPAFDPDHFLSGAKVAYEMIVTAFADGDREALRNLLAPEVFDGFVAAIAERESRGERVESTFIGIDDARFNAAELEGRTARLSVRFVSQMISVTHDSAGRVVDGDPSAVQTIRDVWTFARDIRARDPNWKLVATEAA